MIPIINPDKKVVNQHFEAIYNHINNSRLKYSYDKINQWFLTNGSRKSFKDIIIADHDTLKEIKNDYFSQNYPDEIKYISRRLYSHYFANANVGFGDNKYSAATLTHSLGIKVCPYCNKNYINNIYYSGDKVKRTCQIDHFHSKDSYPFLAISFFNLIPCCSTCNHIKSNAVIEYSPYNSYFTASEIGKFEFLITSIDFLSDIKFIDIRFDSIPIFKNNLSTFKLEEQYKFHKDIVQQIFKKRLMYDQFKLKELVSEFNGLFNNEEELINLLYGNVLTEDFSQKPLSKFKVDIYQTISKSTLS